MCCRGEIVVACLGFHDVRDEHMFTVLDQTFLGERQVSISARLVQRSACYRACLPACGGIGADKCRSGRFLLPIEGCSLDRGLSRVPELFLPAGIDLIRVLLEGQEGALDLLMRLCVLNHAIGKGDIPIDSSLPHDPCCLALAARRGSLLRAVLVAEGSSASRQNHIGMTQILEEGRKTQCVHASRDDWSGLWHALPLLVVVWPISVVLLEHECNVLV
mmetsp:Transcript_39372/g.85997  ORF Transcript_39372/g.85997 Transcript_39372/m.85997 type:complete len:218 (+) Transcript_39372:3-656(+)